MNRFRILRLVLYLAFILAGLFPASHASAQESKAFLLNLDGIIDPNHARYLARSLNTAQERGGEFVIIEIDTPGGLVSSMRDMVSSIRASRIPVITFVSPQGARAASAGTFITAAGHLAVMAPVTNIGAAKVVGGGGQDLPADLKDKATNDAAALIRSIAEERGRSQEAMDALEATVRGADAFSATEALELGIIDFIAEDLDDLVAKLDGMTVRLGSEEVVLDTKGVSCSKPRQSCTSLDLSIVERFLSIIADPNISAILLSVGGLGILIEFLNPGLLFPGIFGAIALVLAFVALGNLPVNWAGVGLILFALVLFYFEFQAPGGGVFGIGGLIAFILGTVFLFAPFAADPPSISAPRASVNPWLIGGLAGGLGLIIGTLSFLAWRGRRGPPAPLRSSLLIGTTGRVTLALDPVGTVHLAEEPWSAEEENGQTVALGERVEVLRAEGLKMIVRKVPKLLPAGEEARTGLDGKGTEG